MRPLVRIALLLLLAVIFASVVSSIVVARTGFTEKVVLAALAVLVAPAVPRVRRPGHPTAR